MVFAKLLGFFPAMRTFSAGPSWEEHHVSFAELGLDGTDIIGIAFRAGPETGSFAFSLDDVVLEPTTTSAR